MLALMGMPGLSCTVLLSSVHDVGIVWRIENGRLAADVVDVAGDETAVIVVVVTLRLGRRRANNSGAQRHGGDERVERGGGCTDRCTMGTAYELTA